jgi:phage terminase small subunit
MADGNTESVKSKLTARQKLFCEYFASDREFFGNGVQSYIEAYNIDASKKGAYNSARVSAHDLLTKPNILKYIDELFDARGLNDTFVDKQLEKMITQDADFSTKIKAIAEYNKLKGRITAKSEVKVDLPKPIMGGTSVRQDDSLQQDSSA